MPTIYLFPDRRPDLMDDYLRLTEFTKEEILERCHSAIGNGRTAVFEADITDEQLAELINPDCEIPWIYKNAVFPYDDAEKK